MSGSGPPLPYGAALIASEEYDAIKAVLRSGTLYRYHGYAVAEFERRFAARLGSEVQALAVNSGSTALQLAFSSAGLEPGDEVIVPTVGFVSIATAVSAAGGTPKFMPVDRSLCLDAGVAASAVGSKTRAALAVHVYGSACPVSPLRELVPDGGFVVEDVAQACGGDLHGAPLGTLGDVAAFSFQHFKLVSTGEGGMVVSANTELLDQAVFMHDAAAAWTRPEVTERVRLALAPPTNLRMSELAAAVGLAQLDRLGETIGRLRVIKQQVQEALSGVAGLEWRPHADAAGDVATHVVLYLPDHATAADAVGRLRRHGVSASLFIDPETPNRHWAGDWHPVLERCRIELPEPEIIERDRETLGPAIVMQLDVRMSDAARDAWVGRVQEGLS